jgi:hypothetical protein
MMDGKEDKRSGECYNCRGRGHYAFMCPTREQRHSLYCEENPPEEEAEQHSPVATPANDVETPEETLEYADLPLCVIR